MQLILIMFSLLLVKIPVILFLRLIDDSVPSWRGWFGVIFLGTLSLLLFWRINSIHVSAYNIFLLLMLFIVLEVQILSEMLPNFLVF